MEGRAEKGGGRGLAHATLCSTRAGGQRRLRQVGAGRDRRLAARAHHPREWCVVRYAGRACRRIHSRVLLAGPAPPPSPLDAACAHVCETLSRFCAIRTFAYFYVRVVLVPSPLFPLAWPGLVLVSLSEMGQCSLAGCFCRPTLQGDNVRLGIPHPDAVRPGARPLLRVGERDSQLHSRFRLRSTAKRLPPPKLNPLLRDT